MPEVVYKMHLEGELLKDEQNSLVAPLNDDEPFYDDSDDVPEGNNPN